MIRHQLIGKEVAEIALRAMTTLPITMYANDSLHREALGVSVRFNIKAAYDAHYLALADHLKCDLWTADKRLYNSVHDHLQWVQLIDFEQK